MSRSSTDWITVQRRSRIYRRDGYRCLWCASVVSKRTATLDHLVPINRGGNDATQNLFTACVSCNSRRKDMSVYHFAYLMSEPLLGAGAEPCVMRIMRAVAAQLPR